MCNYVLCDGLCDVEYVVEIYVYQCMLVVWVESVEWCVVLDVCIVYEDVDCVDVCFEFVDCCMDLCVFGYVEYCMVGCEVFVVKLVCECCGFFFIVIVDDDCCVGFCEFVGECQFDFVVGIGNQCVVVVEVELVKCMGYGCFFVLVELVVCCVWFCVYDIFGCWFGLC